MKTCKGCGQEKSNDNFYPFKRLKASGWKVYRRGYCKACDRDKIMARKLRSGKAITHFATDNRFTYCGRNLTNRIIIVNDNASCRVCTGSSSRPQKKEDDLSSLHWELLSEKEITPGLIRQTWAKGTRKKLTLRDAYDKEEDLA